MFESHVQIHIYDQFTHSLGLYELGGSELSCQSCNSFSKSITHQILEECLLESCFFLEMMGGRICYFVGKKCKWAVFTGQGWGQ